MATVYSVQKTNWDQTVPKDNLKPNEQHGRVRIAYATYEASSLASGDVIEMFNLPDNARVLDGYLLYDALASSTTLSVGYAAHKTAAGATVSLSAAKFLAATSTSSAGRTDIAATIALGAGTEVDADTDGYPISATMGGASGTGTIVMMMRYVTD
jgi:hypothetical protein